MFRYGAGVTGGGNSDRQNTIVGEFEIRTRNGQTHTDYLASRALSIEVVLYLACTQLIRQLFRYVIYMDKTRTAKPL